MIIKQPIQRKLLSSGQHYYECANCSSSLGQHYHNFCPHCGQVLRDMSVSKQCIIVVNKTLNFNERNEFIKKYKGLF